MGRRDKSSKRKNREIEVAADVLSPQSGGVDQNALEVIDDLNEPTMGEKLASLNLGGNELPPNDNDLAPLVKPPSADSVYILLKQALRADDRSLIIECIHKQDEKVISNSLSLLDPSDALKLLKSLISIIQLRGSVVVCAIPWLRTLLLQHASVIISQEASLTALSSLYQLIESRVANFSSALQLSNSLDLFYSEIIDDEDKASDAIVPVIYEDDETDGDESGDSMEVESVEGGEEVQIKAPFGRLFNMG